MRKKVKKEIKEIIKDCASCRFAKVDVNGDLFCVVKEAPTAQDDFCLSHSKK